MKFASKSKALGVRALAAGLAVGFGLMASPAARAQSSTFANFTQANPGAQSFVGTNNTTSFSISTAASAVNFNFSSSIPGLPAGLLGTQSATETITGSVVTAPATVDGNNQITQPFNASETIHFVLNTPFNGLTNLLTVTFTTTSSSGLTGATGATTAGLNGSTPSGDTVVFTSDFLNFSNTSARGFSIALSSINPVLSVGPGGFVNSFTASQSGSFSSTPVPTAAVPVPPSAFLLGLGLLGVPTARILGRRRKMILAFG